MRVCLFGVSGTSVFIAMATIGLSIVGFVILYAAVFLIAGLPARRLSIPSIPIGLRDVSHHRERLL